MEPDASGARLGSLGWAPPDIVTGYEVETVVTGDLHLAGHLPIVVRSQGADAASECQFLAVYDAPSLVLDTMELPLYPWWRSDAGEAQYQIGRSSQAEYSLQRTIASGPSSLG